MRSTTDGTKTLIPRNYAIPAFLALVAAGLAGNYCRYEIFFNIQFIFGSVFAMLALQVLGLGPGVLAALLISSITWPLWNHPYAIVILTCEVLVVGWLNRRRNVALVLADALYWLCIGIPLAFLFSFGVMHLAVSTATVTGVKLVINGVANALAARLMFMAVYSRSRKVLFSLQEMVLNLLALFVLAPSLTILAIESRDDLRDTDRRIRDALIQTSKRVTQSLDLWLDGHLTQVDNLADMAAWNTLPAMQRSLDKLRTADDDFLRLGLLDSTATTVAYSPLFDQLGQAGIGRNFTDRPYLPLLKQAMKPMLSEVVMGRFGPPRPMVTLLAPVLANGSFAGYVGGILDLEGIRDIIALGSEGDGMLYTLLDRNGRVVVTNRAELKVMDEFRRGSGDATSMEDGVSQWIPARHKNVALTERWRNSSYIKESVVGNISEWKLVLEQPIAPFQQMLYDQYAALAKWVLALLLAALLFGEFFSRKVVASLDQLNALSTDLPNKLADGAGIAWIGSSSVETERLFENFEDMAGALSLKFNEIRGMNAVLETRVAERTRSLQESEGRYRQFFENNQSIMLVIDPKGGDIVDVNPAASAYYGWSREEMQGKKLAEINTLSPAELAAELARAKSQDRYHRVFRHRQADGTVRDVEVYGGPIQIAGATLLLSVIHDITARKQAEVQVLHSLQEKEVLLKEIHHRVKNNMQVIYSLLNLQVKTIADGTVRAMFEESRDRVSTMALIHEQLYRSDDLAHIDFKAYLESLVQGIAGTHKRREIDVSIDMESIALDVSAGIPCGLIVNELVANSFKHAFPAGRKGTIRVGMSRNAAGGHVLTVTDDGVGFPADVDFRNTSSIGLQLVNVLARQIHGTIELARVGGTRFVITFPGPAAAGNGHNG